MDVVESQFSRIDQVCHDKLRAAAERDSGGAWLRTDEGTATFGGALDQVALLAERLRTAGVRRGVRVLAPTEPPPAAGPAAR